MWICANDGFVSIVDKAQNPRALLVRARRRQDLLAIFPDAKVWESTKSDYRYRAEISRGRVASVIAARLLQIDYDNFKDSVKDRPLHDAYARVWTEMGRIQPGGPYSDLWRGPLLDQDGDPADELAAEEPPFCESCGERYASEFAYGASVCDVCMQGNRRAV